MLARLAVVLVALLAWSVGTAHAGRSALVIGVTQFPSTLHPGFGPMHAKTYLLGLVRRPVTAYDDQSRLVCLLCDDLPTLENGKARLVPRPDGGTGMAVTFTLRPAFWADGQPLTARDVAFGWQVGRGFPGYLNHAAHQRISAIEVISDTTFTVSLDRVIPDYNHLPIAILPSHLETGRLGDDYAARSVFATDPTDPGLYAGPYRIAAFAPGRHAVLERNPHWRGRVPAVERIVVRLVESAAALEAGLMAGEIDYAPGELGLGIHQALALMARASDRFHAVVRTALHFEHIDITPGLPAFQDRRVRRALLHALDRADISRSLFGGLQPVAHSPVSPSDPNYCPGAATYPYDPDRANALLDEAGWTRGPDGRRRDKEGRLLEVALATTTGSRSRELVQQTIQQQWGAVGIGVTLMTMPGRVLFNDLASRRFTGMALFAWPQGPRHVPRATLHSSEAATGFNIAGYRNPELDRVIEALETELDPEARLDLWRRLQEIYAADLPALPLFFRTELHVMTRALAGVTPTGHEWPATLWAERWELRQDRSEEQSRGKTRP